MKSRGSLLSVVISSEQKGTMHKRGKRKGGKYVKQKDERTKGEEESTRNMQVRAMQSKKSFMYMKGFEAKSM